MGRSNQEKSNKEKQLGETRNVNYLNILKVIHLKPILYHIKITCDMKILKGILYLTT